MHQPDLVNGSKKENFVDSYLREMLKANEVVNLTRITDLEDARILHLEDSLSALPELLNAPDGRYGDLGTGGGFPGVPLAVYSGRETVLVDSVKKKAKVIESILNKLESDYPITIFDGRIEDLSKEEPEQFSVLTARALSSLNSLLELASPLLKENGELICFKGDLQQNELQDAIDIGPLVGLELKSRRAFLLSDGKSKREILTFVKSGKPKVKLPRRVGMAQKKPLVKR